MAWKDLSNTDRRSVIGLLKRIANNESIMDVKSDENDDGTGLDVYPVYSDEIDPRVIDAAIDALNSVAPTP